MSGDRANGQVSLFGAEPVPEPKPRRKAPQRRAPVTARAIHAQAPLLAPDTCLDAVCAMAPSGYLSIALIGDVRGIRLCRRSEARDRFAAKAECESVARSHGLPLRSFEYLPWSEPIPYLARGG